MEKLEQRIERFLRSGEGDFDALALELFAYQFEKNIPYQAFCKAQGRAPASVKQWSDIPAVPIAAFKSNELVTFPIGRAAAVFHSSGTTRQTPSRHLLKNLSYYEASLTHSFSRWVLPDQASLPFLVLTPPPAEAPHSSLTWMLDVVMCRWGAPESAYFIQRGRVDDLRLTKVLGDFQTAGKPVALLGTTLAFLTLFDQYAKQQKTFHCAPGSRLMDTGGMKTQTQNVSREDFLRRAWATLGIPEALSINEYGMCELSSQFYARGASPVFQGPPWVRSQVVDGLLRHFDLANVDSVMAIQTDDEGETRPEGFVLKGRAPGSPLKGCSIDMEAYLKPA